MRRKLSFLMALMIVLIGTFRFISNVQVECSSPRTITVPDNYPTIQEAINAADSGDTVYVRAGVYQENIVVDKSVLIVGEDSSVTVVDGMRNGHAIHVEADNVSITDLTITNSSEWPYIGLLVESKNCNISENNITNTQDGIWVYCSFNNTISGNSATANMRFGIGLWDSSNNTISRNNIIDNGGKGIILEDSSNHNHIAGNTISLNDHAIWLSDSGNNKIFHNNFINNTYQVDLSESFNNTWDNGYPSGGNYWSDYTGIDSDYDAYPHPVMDNGYPYQLVIPELPSFLILPLFMIATLLAAIFYRKRHCM